MAKLTELAREHNIKYCTVRYRLDHGWSLYDTLIKPVKKRKFPDINLEELAKQCGININTLKHRLYRIGMSLEEALSKPVRRHNKYKTKE